MVLNKEGILAKHRGQVDKLGKDYSEHLLFVSNKCESYSGKRVGLGHDLLEDTDTTVEELYSFGYTNDEVKAIKLLTRTKNITYKEYIKTLSENKICIEVKLADLTHNLLPERSKGLSPSLRERYLDAFILLSSKK